MNDPNAVSREPSPRIAKLALEDGTVFTGVNFGATGTRDGEVVFNTSMTGYQEILTDPSYRGQIVTMTYPEIGNYGVNEEDRESLHPHLAGFVVRNLSRVASNFRASEKMEDYLRRYQIIGIVGIDTRALVRHIRSQGAMKGVLSTEILDDSQLIEMAANSPGLVGRDLVKEVIPLQPIDWREKLSPWWSNAQQVFRSVDQGRSVDQDDTQCDMAGLQPESRRESCESLPHVVALDFGMKWNIARHLFSQQFRVTVLPGTSSFAEIMNHRPDGIFLSNGPGDPEPLTYAIETIQLLLGQVPIFGICLGHQLLCLACGAGTFKLKFGHRGANQPVQELRTSKIEITSQNHGFAVDEADFPDQLEITHRNLNDQTIAGVRHRQLPAFSVQYHPEASAGPHDSQYLFDQFRALINAAVNGMREVDSSSC